MRKKGTENPSPRETNPEKVSLYIFFFSFLPKRHRTLIL
jgi:hypothetical protein